MTDISTKNLDVAWTDDIWTGKEPPISDLAKLIFGLYALAVRLNKLGDDTYEEDLYLYTKITMCLTLLSQYLLQKGLESLEELEETPLDLVPGIHKVPFHGCYLPLSIVGVLIYVKKYPSIARVYPRTPPCGRYA